MAIREVPAGEAVRYGEFEVRTFPVDHSPSSIGLALVEDDRLGRFDIELVRKLGVPEGPAYDRLHRGEDVTLDTGEVIRASDVVGPARRGRKVVYPGDSRPCEASSDVASGADLLIHEATFSEEEAARARDTRHSTAREAAEVAAEAQPVRLFLTHFSARHSEQAHRLVKEAEAIYPATAAEDGQTVEIHLRDEPVARGTLR